MQHAPTESAADRPPPPLLALVWRGTFWLALKLPIQVVIAFVSIPLVQHAIGAEANGAYVFAWGFGFIQLLLEFGMSSALQQQLAHAWASGDRAKVDRLVGSATTFYAVTSLVQVAILLGIAYYGLPPKFQGEPRRLIVGLLWIQAVSAPFFGLVTVATCVLQAGRRYELIPRVDLVLIVLRFAALVLGLRAKVDFLAIVAVQTAILLIGTLVPALWVMARDLRCLPHFLVPRRGDYGGLARVGVYVFLMQLSIVLADMVDTTILSYALPDADPGSSITLYQNVSRPFFQIRQLGWALVSLVIPATASLAATRDLRGIEALKYDGTRHLVALLLPVALLAGIDAGPFLGVWVGPEYARHAPLLRLFLVATLPLMFSVLTKMAFGMGEYRELCFSSLGGSLVNLPLSYYLTARYGVPGVIWGTVLTTLVSNLLLPGIYLFRLLEVRTLTFLARSLGAPLAGAVALVAAAYAFGPPAPAGSAGGSILARSSPLLFHLGVSLAGYALGYLAAPRGRDDLRALVRQLRRRSFRPRPSG